MTALITIYITIPKQTLIYDIFPWLIWDSCLSQDLRAILLHKNWSLQGLVDPPIFSPVQLLFILCTPLQATINFMPPMNFFLYFCFLHLIYHRKLSPYRLMDCLYHYTIKLIFTPSICLNVTGLFNEHQDNSILLKYIFYVIHASVNNNSTLLL